MKRKISGIICMIIGGTLMVVGGVLGPIMSDVQETWIAGLVILSLLLPVGFIVFVTGLILFLLAKYRKEKPQKNKHYNTKNICFRYAMSLKDAKKVIKKAISGKFAIKKETDNSIKFGAPFMYVTVTLQDGCVYIKKQIFGGSIAGTIKSELDGMGLGFAKVDKSGDYDLEELKIVSENNSTVVSASTKADELIKLKSLLDSNSISKEEYDILKSELIAK